MLFHGRIDSKYSYGTNEILKSGGILTTEIEDILKKFPQFANKKRKIIHKSCDVYNFKNKKYELIIKILEKPRNIDEIMNILNLERKEILNLLFEMQLENIIEEEIGVGYKLRKK